MKPPSIPELKSELEGAPLSFAQERLWFLQKLDPADSSYNLSTAWKCHGPLDVEGLQWALNEAVRRHDVLRSIFVEFGGIPRQIVNEGFELKLPILHLDPANLIAYCSEQALKPFDIGHAPGIRACLVRLGDREHVLQLVFHHIVADGWSLGIFVKDTIKLYQAFKSGLGNLLPPLQIQYSQYALEQRALNAGFDNEIAYWRKQLSGILPLQLPTDRPLPKVPTHRAQRLSFNLPAELTKRLQNTMQQEGVTLFMLLLTGFYLLLARYSGQEDVTVGTPVATREKRELEHLVGIFLNSLVLRADLQGDPSTRELLSRVRQMCLDAFAHQNLPFERLVEELNPERDLRRPPLFQVMFALQNAPMPFLNVAGIHFEFLELESATTQMDLSLSVWQHGKEMNGWVDYSIDLFDAASVQRMMWHWQHLLEQMTTHAERRIPELAILTDEEQRQLVVEWNLTQQPYPSENCLHELLEIQAQKAPEAVAVVFEEQALTYKELDRRANQLANYLRGLGIACEDRTGICLERSLDMIVALLGTLKAGGAYVPLDPEYPAERIAYILADAQINVLLTQERMRNLLPATDVKVLALDSEWHKIATESQQRPRVNCLAQNAAYVIYTSGSTGRPKGVIVPHRGVVNVLLAFQKIAGMEARDRFFASTTLTFDIAALELYLPLLTGAQVLLANEEGIGRTDSGQSLQATEATLMQATPNGWKFFMSTGWTGNPNVKTLCGGEDLDSDLANELLRRGGGLWNVYGPTETTIWSSAYKVLETVSGKTVSIGRPIANTQIYILDRHLYPVPIGVPGNIYIGGAGVARGYLNQSELTSEKFIPDAFSQSPGERLYSVGDVGRWAEDGTIQFLGRSDHQVKVRGYRIEPGEIESLLCQMEEIRDAVVIADEDKPGQKRLVAYVVGNEGWIPDIGKMRQHLLSALPAYMVPAGYVILKDLPLTSNGKLDRRALPKAPVSRSNSRANQPPRTPFEELVCGIWMDVLELGQIGIHDNFFELGGHSLLATQVIARIQEMSGHELPLSETFERPTVAMLADGLEEILQPPEQKARPALEVVKPRESYPLSFAQERLWRLSQQTKQRIPNILFGIKITGELCLENVRTSVVEILRRHRVLQIRIITVKGIPVQIVDGRAELSLEYIDLRSNNGLPADQRMLQIIDREAQEKFDFDSRPPVRFKVLSANDREHLLLVNMSAIIADNHSAEIIAREFEVLQAQADTQELLDDLPIQYVDFAAWQRSWLQGEALQQEIECLKARLSGIVPLELPADRLDAITVGAQKETIKFDWPAEFALKLRQFSRQEGITLFMLLLSGFEATLHRYTGQNDVAVLTDVLSGSIETAGLIGPFTNHLPVQVTFTAGLTFKGLLRHVRESCLENYYHRELSWEDAVDHANSVSLAEQEFRAKFVMTRRTANCEQLFTEQMQASPEGKHDTHVLLSVADSGQQLSGTMTYRADLYERATIAGILDSYHHFLDEVCSDPLQLIAAIPLLPQYETEKAAASFMASLS